MEASKRVGFLPRVGASLIDLLVLLPFFGAVFGALYYLESNARLTPAVEYLLGIATTIGGIAYGSFEIFKAGTPGKLVLGQRIVAVNGSAAPTAALVNRYLLKHVPDLIGLAAAVTSLAVLDKISSFASVGMLLGFLTVLGAARQAPWDQLAGTVVARKKDLEQQPGFQPLMTAPVAATVPTDHPPDAREADR